MQTNIPRPTCIGCLCLLVVISIAGTTPGLGGASPHTGDHSHHTTDHGGFYAPPNLTNHTVYLYANPQNPTAPDNPHAPGSNDVSKWSESITPRTALDENRHAWIDVSRSFTFQDSRCDLQNLQFFGIERTDATTGPPPDNGTGGPEARTSGAYDDYESLFTAVDTDGRETHRGFQGSEAWVHWRDITGPEGGPDRWALTDAKGDYFIKHTATAFWTPAQAEGNQNRKPFNFSNWDRIIVDRTDCFTNPDTPGWYRQAAFSESYFSDSGDSPDSADALAGNNRSTSFSHWIYICDCETYDAAVTTIGPPPDYILGDAAHQTRTPTPGKPPSVTATAQVSSPTATMRPEPATTTSPVETATQTSSLTPRLESPTPAVEVGTATQTHRGTPAGDTGQPGFDFFTTVVAALGTVLLIRIVA